MPEKAARAKRSLISGSSITRKRQVWAFSADGAIRAASRHDRILSFSTGRGR